MSCDALGMADAMQAGGAAMTAAHELRAINERLRSRIDALQQELAAARAESATLTEELTKLRGTSPS